MKGCTVAAVILVLVICMVTVNAYFVRSVTRELLAQVEKLPKEPDSSETPKSIRSIHDYLRMKSAFLSITIPYTTIDRVSEALLTLETYATNNDSMQYKVTLTLIYDLVEELSRNERITTENILAHVVLMGNVSHYLFKFVSMGLEKIVIQANVGQLGPFFCLYGDRIQIIDPGTPHGQQKGGVGGDDELTAVKTGAVLYETGKLGLPFGGQTVFRLVQQVQGVAADLLGKIAVGVLSVGLTGEILGETAGGEVGAGTVPRVTAMLKLLQILQRSDLKATLPHIVPFVEQLLPLAVNALVESAKIQHIVEYIITGDDTALFRRLLVAVQLRAAEFQIFFEKGRTAEGRSAGKLQLLGDDIENGGLSGAVAAVQKGDGCEIQPLQILEGKDLEGVGVVDVMAGHVKLVAFGVRIAGRATAQKIASLIRFGGQAEGFQIDHGKLLSGRIVYSISQRPSNVK